MRNLRKPFVSAIAATAAALVIAACGGDDKKDPNAKSLDDSNPDNPAFHVAADASKFGGAAPLRVTFYSEAFNEHGTVHWRWRFDDGTTSEERNPSHTFSRPGYYQVLMEARDARGADAWNLILGVWPKDVWEASSKQGRPGVVQIKKLQRAQDRRTLQRRREQAAKSKQRAEQYSSGRSEL
jgi:hypothetical protein